MTPRSRSLRRSIFVPYAIMVFVMVAVIAGVFNVAFTFAIKQNINRQLLELSAIAESIALNDGPLFLPGLQPPPGAGGSSGSPSSSSGAMPPNASASDSSDAAAATDSGKSGTVASDASGAAASDSSASAASSEAGTTASDGTGTAMPDDPGAAASPDSDPLHFSFYLDHALRGQITLVNANYLLVDTDGKILAPSGAAFFSDMADIFQEIVGGIEGLDASDKVAYRNLQLNGTSWWVAYRHLGDDNPIGLKWVIIFTDASRVSEILTIINLILVLVLLIAAGLTTWLSANVSRSIARPFTQIREQLSEISEMRFPQPLPPPQSGVGEIRELTEAVNKLSDRMQQHNQAQKNVLQNVSHEFRTPLMSIRSYAEGIQHDVVPKEDAIPVILSETARLTRLVEDLLYLSRLDFGSDEVLMEETDLAEWVPDVIQRVRVLADSAGKRILHPASIPHAMFRCNRDQLTRALINVLSNSISFATSTVRVLLSVTGTDIHIIVEDDGPGFREEDIPHLFERFYKGRRDGIGLGLSISRSIMQVHGGRISVENSGRGAVIHLMLPIDPEGRPLMD